MQIGVQSEFLSIPVPTEPYPLVQRHFRRAKKDTTELNRAAEALLGRFILVNVSEEYGTLMVAQITDLTSTVSKDNQDTPSIIYKIVYDGIGLVDPSSPANDMIPLDPENWRKMQNRTITYGSLKEIEDELLPTTTSGISGLEYYGEKIRTPKLSLMGALLLGTRYLLEDFKDMVRK